MSPLSRQRALHKIRVVLLHWSTVWSPVQLHGNRFTVWRILTVLCRMCCTQFIRSSYYWPSSLQKHIWHCQRGRKCVVVQYIETWSTWVMIIAQLTHFLVKELDFRKRHFKTALPNHLYGQPKIVVFNKYYNIFFFIIISLCRNLWQSRSFLFLRKILLQKG